MLNNKSVAAIIVTYNPNLQHLERMINEFEKMGLSKVIVVDNTGSKLDLNKRFLNSNLIVVLENKENVGIATAQNQGLKYALDLGVKYAWQFDQDSDVESLDLDCMISELENISINYKVACIGPTIVNKFSMKLDLPKKKKRIESCYLVDQIITSGCLIPLKCLQEIGLMEESLFIDAVDFEWCWRARSLNYQVLISSATMTHSVGEGDIKAFGIINLRVAKPFRLFYQVRNFFNLLPRSYVPTRWKIRNFIGYILKFIYFGFFHDDSSLYRKNMILGVKSSFYKK